MGSRRCRNKQPRGCTQHSPAQPHPWPPRSQAPISSPPETFQPSAGTGKAVLDCATLSRTCRQLFDNQGCFFPHLQCLRQAEPAGTSTISQLAHTCSSPPRIDSREVCFGSWVVFSLQKHHKIQQNFDTERGDARLSSLSRQNLQYSGQVPQCLLGGKARPRLSRQW